MTARSLASIALCVRQRTTGDAVIERSFLPIAILRRGAVAHKSTVPAAIEPTPPSTPERAPSPEPTSSPTVAR